MNTHGSTLRARPWMMAALLASFITGCGQDRRLRRFRQLIRKPRTGRCSARPRSSRRLRRLWRQRRDDEPGHFYGDHGSAGPAGLDRDHGRLDFGHRIPLPAERLPPDCIYTETPLNIGAVNGTINTAPPPPNVACPTEGTAATFAAAQAAAAAALAAFNDLSPASRPGATDPGANLGGLTLAPGHLRNGQRRVPDHRIGPHARRRRQRQCGVGLPDGEHAHGRCRGSAAQHHPGRRRAAQERFLAGRQLRDDQRRRGRDHGGDDHLVRSDDVLDRRQSAAITTLNGRALALNASVTLVNTVINVPAP